ncbi:hypothetical protein V6N12_076236 [Hibiscus sabdariffa]|uniref:DUF4220 domain-containing protein n=1 Tax=Hibiscus sabdariffa TaxID=183260 RepID=A0ABR1ZJW6_9ROSI
MVKPWVGILLWLAYLSADWVATAALGKLSYSCVHGSCVTNTLRGWWASLLLLHLGGPDTITAYSMEDNLLWRRHLLGLAIQVALAVYVIVLSWTTSWLSLLNFLLFSVGVIKYSERTWCLYSASSKDSRRKAPLFDGRIFENINQKSQKDVGKVVLAYHWFALRRQDIGNHFSTTGSLRSLLAKIAEHVFQQTHLESRNLELMIKRSQARDVFDIVVIESGFMFDMLYTKSAIVFSKLGCFLRFISFCCSSFVLVFFLHSFGIENSSSVDVCITGILLAGAVAFEFYGLFLILSSDWFVVLGVGDNKSRLWRGIFRIRRSLLKHREKKRWSDCMGQFNLLRYCKSFRKGTKILEMVGVDELMHKYWHTSFRAIPLSLKKPESFPDPTEVFEQGDDNIPPHFFRGEKALQRYNCTDKTVKESLLMDLSATIIIWHIATDICYTPRMSTTTDERVITCKVMSDYMMYLLAKKPSMVSEDDNFWFDSVSGKLRRKLRQNTLAVGDDATIYRRFSEEIASEEDKSAPSRVILRHAIRVAEVLRSREAEEQWEMMRSVWLEMMHYAAMRCPHVSHLQELSQGGEILSLYWLLASYNIYENSNIEEGGNSSLASYQCADPVVIAALGMLSSSCVHESGVSNTLRGWWASLVLMHLGGPDTITAYSMEETSSWASCPRSSEAKIAEYEEHVLMQTNFVLMERSADRDDVFDQVSNCVFVFSKYRNTSFRCIPLSLKKPANFGSGSQNLRGKLQPEDDATIDRQLLESISRDQDVGVPSRFILEALSSREEDDARCPHVSHLQQLSLLASSILPHM